MGSKSTEGKAPLTSGLRLLLGLANNVRHLPGGRQRLRLVVVLAALLAAALLSWVALAPPSTHYILVMDAGSSGTRLYAYTWRPGPAPGDPPIVEAIPPSAAQEQVPRRVMAAKRAYQRVETEPGLDQFVGKSTELQKKAIGPLLKWAKAVVPRWHWHRTPVFLCATAGLRKLPDQQQDQLMRDVKNALRRSSFKFEKAWARIISGEDEGVYGWIALNYLAGSLSPSKQLAAPPHPGTVGVLDLGGSSLEVAFELDGEAHGNLGPASKDVVNISVLGQERSLYVHVHHHYGLNDAFDRSVTLLLSRPPPALELLEGSMLPAGRGSGSSAGDGEGPLGQGGRGSATHKDGAISSSTGGGSSSSVGAVSGDVPHPPELGGSPKGKSSQAKKAEGGQQLHKEQKPGGVQPGSGKKASLPTERKSSSSAPSTDKETKGAALATGVRPEEDARLAADLAVHEAQLGERAQQRVAVQQEYEQQAGSGSGNAARKLLALFGFQSRGGSGGEQGAPQAGLAAGAGEQGVAAAAFQAIGERLAAEEQALQRHQPGIHASGGSSGSSMGRQGQAQHGRQLLAATQVRLEPPGEQASASEAAVRDSHAGAAATAAGGGDSEVELVEVAHPCLHKGYAKPYTRLLLQGIQPDPQQVLLVGRPDAGACAKLAGEVVNASAPCGAAACALGAPAPPATGPFHALTGFYVVYHFFGLHSRSEMRQLDEVWHDFCGKPWQEVESERANEIHVDRYCFRAPFVRALLGDGLRVDPGRVQLGSPDIGWTLGAALAEGSRLGLGSASARTLLPSLALPRLGLPHLPHLGRRTRLLVLAGGLGLLLGAAALARRRGPGSGGGAPSPGVLPKDWKELGSVRVGLPGERGGGSLLALPGHPEMPSSPTSPTPFYQRVFGTPTKKRGQPPRPDASAAWGQTYTSGRMRRDASANSFSLARSQPVSRRGVSQEDLTM